MTGSKNGRQTETWYTEIRRDESQKYKQKTSQRLTKTNQKDEETFRLFETQPHFAFKKPIYNWEDEILRSATKI